MKELFVSTLTPQTGTTITVSPPSYIASPGAPIQTLYYRTDERSQWSAPVGGYDSANRILPLGLTIAPRKPNSLITMQWNITGEVHWNTVFVIFVNNVPVSTSGYQGYNNAPAQVGNWIGYSSGSYDAAGDVNSTLEQFKILYSIVLDSTTTVTFYPAIKSADTTARVFNLNRTNGALGQDSYENGISTGVIMEIAQ